MSNNLGYLILAGAVVLVLLNMSSNKTDSRSSSGSDSPSVTPSVTPTVPVTNPSVKPEKFSYTEGFDSLELEGFDNKVGSGTPGSPKAEFVIKSAKLGNNFGGGKFITKLTGAGGNVGPNTTKTITPASISKAILIFDIIYIFRIDKFI